MTTIKIDIDNITMTEFLEESNILNNKITKLCRIHKISTIRLDLYSTRRGFHLYISFDNMLTPYQILIWQIILNSDIERELFNYDRIVNNRLDHWNVLFTQKFIGGKLTSEEKLINSQTFKMPEEGFV